MKAIYKFLILILVILFSSCKKTIRDVHFHGKITYRCVSDPPVSNMNFNIIRDYEKDGEKSQTITNLTTGIDGSYNTEADVDDIGKFIAYHLVPIERHDNLSFISDRVNVGGEAQDVAINATVRIAGPFSFHIKNVSPYDINDSFDNLSFHPDGFTPDTYTLVLSDSTVSNLHGTDVDLYYKVDRFLNVANYSTLVYYFKYMYTKNSISYEEYDTIQTSCFDTTYVDIFY